MNSAGYMSGWLDGVEYKGRKHTNREYLEGYTAGKQAFSKAVLGYRGCWQDWILAICEVVFIISVWGTLTNPSDKVSLLTSIPTAIALGLATIAQYSMGLKKAGIMTFITTLEWVAVAILRH